MKNRMNVIAVLAAVCALALTGCGQRVDTPVTEAQTQAPVQKITEAATEAVTEAIVVATEAVTEAPAPQTEVQTEAVTEAPVNLTSDEEQAAESELAENKTLYAKDDMNVRTTPSTESGDNIFASYDQGETVTITGETPNWYVVSKDDTKGYVYKANLSETTVDPKTEEERANEAAAAESSDAAATTDSSSSDEAVGAYAESFTVQLAGDANLRVSPNENGDVIDIVPADTIVTCTGSSDSWYEVSYDGQVGYINKNLVK